MNELFNIIKSSLRSNSFYIPSQNTYVNGCSLTIKQYNELLELDATVSLGFEQYIKFSIITDKIISENIDNVDNLLYFDKPFLLSQIKMSQEENFLGFSLQQYQENLKNKMSNIALSAYEATYSNSNLSINFGVNTFKSVQQTNKDFFATLSNNFNFAGDVITLEMFKYLKSINYHNQNIGENKPVKEIKQLVEEMPAKLIETFDTMLKKVNKDIADINTIEIDGDNFICNPTLEFMLS